MSLTDANIPLPQQGGTPLSNDFSIDDILAQIQQQAGANAPSAQGPGGGTGPIPIPIPQKQPRDPAPVTYGAQGEFRTKGAHKRATMESLMGNITSIVTAGIKHQQEKKARQVQFDMERIITILQADPEMKDPQNQKILNDIAGDPKKLKAFQKALGIDFIKPDKNANAPERKGAQAAFSAAQKQDFGAIPMGGGGAQVGPQGQPQTQPQGQPQPMPGGNTSVAPAQQGQPNAGGGLSPQAQQLVGMFPRGPRSQMSPEERLQAEKIKAGLIASADERLKAFTKVIGDYQKAKNTYSEKQLEVVGRLEVAKIVATSRIEAVRQHGKQQESLENLRHTHRIQEIQKRHDLIEKELKPDKKAQMVKEQSSMVDSIIKDLQNKLQHASDTGLSDDEKKNTATQLADWRSYRETLILSMNKVAQEGGVPIGGATSAAGLADQHWSDEDNPDE